MVGAPIPPGFVPFVGSLVGEGQIQAEAAVRAQDEREEEDKAKHEDNPGESQEKVLQRKKITT